MPRILWSETAVSGKSYYLSEQRESYPRAVKNEPVGWSWIGSGFDDEDIRGFLTIDKLPCGNCGNVDTLFVFIQYDGGVGGSSAVQEVWCPRCDKFTSATGTD
jgi:hypothetical protein